MRLPAPWPPAAIHRRRFAGIADRTRTVLADAATLLALVLAVPLVVLVVGAPIVLAIVALLQAGRWALNAF